MSDDNLLTFPCELPIKIVGRNDSVFRDTANAIVSRHYADVAVFRVTEQASRNGAYVSLTFVVHAQSRDEVDALYHELSAADEIVMAL